MLETSNIPVYPGEWVSSLMSDYEKHQYEARQEEDPDTSKIYIVPVEGIGDAGTGVSLIRPDCRPTSATPVLYFDGFREQAMAYNQQSLAQRLAEFKIGRIIGWHPSELQPTKTPYQTLIRFPSGRILTYGDNHWTDWQTDEQYFDVLAVESGIVLKRLDFSFNIKH